MNLKPVDFKPVAAKGCFVYCYLRADGSPYYVGISSRATRPLKKENNETQPPKDLSRVRVMRSGLAWEEACSWEAFYIARFGRVDLGTGILRNKTDGGEGAKNPSPESLKRRSESRKGWQPSPEVREKMRKAQLGKKRPAEVIEKCAAALRGRKRPPEVVAKASAARKAARAEKKRQDALALGMTVDELDAYRQKLYQANSRRKRREERRALGIQPRDCYASKGLTAPSALPEARKRYKKTTYEKVKAAAYALGMTIPKYKEWRRLGCPEDRTPFLRKTSFMTRQEIQRRYYLKKKAKQEAASA